MSKLTDEFSRDLRQQSHVISDRLLSLHETLLLCSDAMEKLNRHFDAFGLEEDPKEFIEGQMRLLTVLSILLNQNIKKQNFESEFYSQIKDRFLFYDFQEENDYITNEEIFDIVSHHGEYKHTRHTWPNIRDDISDSILAKNRWFFAYCSQNAGAFMEKAPGFINYFHNKGLFNLPEQDISFARLSNSVEQLRNAVEVYLGVASEYVKGLGEEDRGEGYNNDAFQKISIELNEVLNCIQTYMEAEEHYASDMDKVELGNFPLVYLLNIKKGANGTYFAPELAQ